MGSKLLAAGTLERREALGPYAKVKFPSWLLIRSDGPERGSNTYRYRHLHI